MKVIPITPTYLSKEHKKYLDKRKNKCYNQDKDFEEVLEKEMEPCYTLSIRLEQLQNKER